MKHTPGPWHVCTFGEQQFPHVHIGKNTCLQPKYFKNQYGKMEKCVSRHITINDNEENHYMETHIANAYLIAAAPDLQEACEQAKLALLSYGPHTKDDAVWNSAFRHVNEALAKAKGGTS